MFEKRSNCCYYYIYYLQKELGFSIHSFLNKAFNRLFRPINQKNYYKNRIQIKSSFKYTIKRPGNS